MGERFCRAPGVSSCRPGSRCFRPLMERGAHQVEGSAIVDGTPANGSLVLTGGKYELMCWSPYAGGAAVHATLCCHRGSLLRGAAPRKAWPALHPAPEEDPRPDLRR